MYIIFQVAKPVEESKRSTLVFESGDIKILPPSMAYIKDINAGDRVRILSLLPDKSVQEFSLKYSELVIKLVVRNGSSVYQILAPNTYEIIQQNRTTSIGEIHIITKKMFMMWLYQEYQN